MKTMKLSVKGGLVPILLLFTTWLFGQAPEKVTISGTVVDSLKHPLTGVTITANNKVMSVTDAVGKFNIATAKGTKLLFSSIGFSVYNYNANASKANLVITLHDANSALDGVVVTALGITRQERALGYSATTVQGEQLTDAISGNWTDALSGKVAGLNMIRSGSGPTASNKIILRGENNLTGDNEALIVVDGVVINQGSGRRSAIAGETVYGTGSDNMPADYGSSINDINPEDIASVTVLKGPGAAALYGQRGANGAIIITTKAGSAKKKG